MPREISDIKNVSLRFVFLPLEMRGGHRERGEREHSWTRDLRLSEDLQLGECELGLRRRESADGIVNLSSII
jgi:hypothetical protein